MSDASDLARRMRADRAEREWARRKVWIWWGVGIVLFIVFIIGAKHAYHWAKQKRAAQFDDAGDKYVQAETWNEAASQYRAALQLDPMGYRPLVSASRLATRLGIPAAADLWEQVMKLPEATSADRQSYAEALLAAGRLAIAQPVIARLLKEAPDTKTLLIAARFSRAQGDPAKAVEFARAAISRAPEDDTPKIMLAELLAVSADDAQHAEARKILWEMAGRPGPFRQSAIEYLAAAPELSEDERNRALKMLEESGLTKIHPALLAADLRLQAEPDQAPKIYDQTVARWNNGDNAQMVELARWLNFHQQAERVMSLCPVERALQDNQLLLCRLDAMATLQLWNDIETLLAQPGLNLDASVLEAFRARTAQEKNATMDAEVHWNHAISLAANDAAKLRFVASFAEQSHANAVALKVYEQLARIPQQTMEAFRATQRLSGRTGDEAVQRSAAERIATLAPNDPNAADQLAYLNLLAANDVEANFEKAKQLAEKYPDRLSFRVTAALGFLRMHDPGPALAQFKGPAGAPPIDWARTPPNWRAVYAAALVANEQPDAAKQILQTIPVDQLTPKEKELIQASR